MDAYFDSAVIVKLYVREATSPNAVRLIDAHVAPYSLTHLQALEVKIAIRLKAFRKEITTAEMNQSIAAFQQDIVSRRWQRPVYSAAVVEEKADELSDSHSAMIGCRTLDILHVAAAIVIGAKEFITFDERQGLMAKQAGLTVKP